MRIAWGVVVVVALFSCSASRVQVLPQLTPIDASRPFFVYAPVEGSGCGEHAVAQALEDLWRIAGDSHGFVAAVIEEHEGDDGPCATVTARPISYGCTPRPPTKVDVDPMHVVPGPTACADAASDACTPDCAKYASVLGGGEFQAKAFQVRCETRCRAKDAAFLSCARAVSTADDVRRCDATR